MKTSKLIWSIVIAAIVIYLIYKAYTNYQISGSIFRSTPLVTTDTTTIIYDNTNPGTVSRFVATGGAQMDTNGHNH